MAGDWKNRSKRRKTCRLDRRYVFFYLFRVLLILTNVFRSYSRFITTGRIGLAGDEKNGPKRRQTRRLGPMCVFFFLLRVFA